MAPKSDDNTFCRSLCVFQIYSHSGSWGECVNGKRDYGAYLLLGSLPATREPDCTSYSPSLL